VLDQNLVEKFVTSDYKNSVQTVLKNAVQGNETANFEFPLIHKDGSHAVQILLNATCRRDHEGRPVGMVGIGQDITDAQRRKEAEMRQREAEAATAAQATISAHVYHEIRNVVGSVLALAERASEAVDLALMESSGESIKKLPAEVRFLMEHQRLVCGHAVNTLNDMLDVSRMENGTYKPSALLIDLGALCQQAAKLQGPRMKNDVQLRLDCPPEGELIVLSDPALLLQYLTNLLSNAAKFTDSGYVMVTCHSTVVERPTALSAGWVERLCLAWRTRGRGSSHRTRNACCRPSPSATPCPARTSGSLCGPRGSASASPASSPRSLGTCAPTVAETHPRRTDRQKPGKTPLRPWGPRGRSTRTEWAAAPPRLTAAGGGRPARPQSRSKSPPP